jgi:hypothetical protein
MKRSFGLLIIALVLAAAGAVSLLAGMFERRMATAQEDMAVLDFEDPQADYAVLQQDLEKLPWVSRATMAEIRSRRAALQYWQGHYADLVELGRAAQTTTNPDEPADPDLQLLVANATFRTAQRAPQDKVTLLKNLDEVIRAYGDALRSGSERADAAYNYELAIRIREEIASGKRKGGISAMVEDKTDANMHGDPGEPPKDMKVQQFQIRVPMDPKDSRSKDETAGTGQMRKRRG